MQIATARMSRCSLVNAGNAIKLGRSGPRRRRLMLLMWIMLSGSLCLMVDSQMKIPPETVQQWAVSFGKEMAALSNRYSGAKLLQKKYKDVEGVVKIEEVNGEELVKTFAEEMEEMLGRKMKSVKRLAEAAEDADLGHEYNETLEFDYFNSLLINTVDEEGNPTPLGGEFLLEKNEHFNKLPVNTWHSNIQVPTNVYNRDPDILNGVYMSEALNDVFIDNFQKDPTLTWQYFGSATGFFRLYPGIQWIPDENGVVTFDCRNRN
ncbi:Voltage-dependent calcium channel subunit alpha-2/delta-4, partial [Characodon lateralis]|nr:Voltage-dependent calcium channel subunit alpha-2/delta-4 [Characodon lateralis]